VEYYADYLKSLEQRPEDLPLSAHYHTWTPESVTRVWKVWTNNRYLRTQFYPREYFEAFLAQARPHLAKVGVVADIGCGTGTMLSILAQAGIGAQLIGVDLSDESLKKLRSAFSGDARLTFKVGSISRIPLDDESCDLVICTETLEHLFPGDFMQGLAEITRVLKPGGHLLTTVPLEERPAFVVCPECYAIFTPFQHMLFNFTIAGLARELGRHGVEIVHVIHPIDTGVPRRAWQRFVKDKILARHLPGLARRLFRVNGVTGFVARKALVPPATAPDAATT
jgi:ubiquinone/menaquinone biosynthesis C-methylase UbiE